MARSFHHMTLMRVARLILALALMGLATGLGSQASSRGARFGDTRHGSEAMLRMAVQSASTSVAEPAPGRVIPTATSRAISGPGPPPMGVTAWGPVFVGPRTTTREAPPAALPAPPQNLIASAEVASAAAAQDRTAWFKYRGSPEYAVLGTSVEGRAITALRVGQGDSLVVLVGGIHQGAEGATTDVVNGLIAALAADPDLLPPNVTVVAIPAANPDGRVLRSRLNARAVDLNRNWPTEDWTDPAVAGSMLVSAGEAPLSEPETAALYRYFEGARPDLVLSWHGNASAVEGNDIEAAEILAASFSDSAGYNLLEKWPYYPITGEMNRCACGDRNPGVRR